MRLSSNDIRARAANFARDWAKAHYEHGETQSFYNAFFAIFDIDRRRVGVYEQSVAKLDGARGFIDLFWHIEKFNFILGRQVARFKEQDPVNIKAAELVGLLQDQLRADALQADWATLLPPERCSYIQGNPPFVGQSYQSKEQREQMRHVTNPNGKTASPLDYVGAWFLKATAYSGRAGFTPPPPPPPTSPNSTPSRSPS